MGEGLDVRWFIDRWWVYVGGVPYRYATINEVWAYAPVFQYDVMLADDGQRPLPGVVDEV